MTRNHLAPPPSPAPAKTTLAVATGYICQGFPGGLEIQLRKLAARSAETDTHRALVTLPEPGGAGRGDRGGGWGTCHGAAGHEGQTRPGQSLPQMFLVALVCKNRGSRHSLAPAWGNRAGLCAVTFKEEPKQEAQTAG